MEVFETTCALTRMENIGLGSNSSLFCARFGALKAQKRLQTRLLVSDKLLKLLVEEFQLIL